MNYYVYYSINKLSPVHKASTAAGAFQWVKKDSEGWRVAGIPAPVYKVFYNPSGEEVNAKGEPIQAAKVK